MARILSLDQVEGVVFVHLSHRKAIPEGATWEEAKMKPLTDKAMKGRKRLGAQMELVIEKLGGSIKGIANLFSSDKTFGDLAAAIHVAQKGGGV